MLTGYDQSVSTTNAESVLVKQMREIKKDFNSPTCYIAKWLVDEWPKLGPTPTGNMLLKIRRKLSIDYRIYPHYQKTTAQYPRSVKALFPNTGVSVCKRGPGKIRGLAPSVW